MTAGSTPWWRRGRARRLRAGQEEDEKVKHRHVLCHYHIFKNAGSSVDASLRQSFGSGWYTYDPFADWGNLTTSQLLAFIECSPNLRACSSHQARWPAPSTETVVALPLVLVRHPIDRVASVYTFLRHIHHPDAAGRDLREFVRWMLGPEGSIVGKSFQTLFLSDDDAIVGRPHGERHATSVTEAHYAEAIRRLDELPAFGIVERFSASTEWLEGTARKWFPELKMRARRENVLRGPKTLPERLADIKAELGPGLYGRLCQCNEADLALYQYATMRFEERRR